MDGPYSPPCRVNQVGWSTRTRHSRKRNWPRCGAASIGAFRSEVTRGRPRQSVDWAWNQRFARAAGRESQILVPDTVYVPPPCRVPFDAARSQHWGAAQSRRSAHRVDRPIVPQRRRPARRRKLKRRRRQCHSFLTPFTVPYGSVSFSGGWTTRGTVVQPVGISTRSNSRSLSHATQSAGVRPSSSLAEPSAP